MIAWGVVASIILSFAGAAGKPAPVAHPFDGKKMIALAPIDTARVVLPDGKVFDFGPDFQAMLTRRLLEGGKYLVADSETVNSQSLVKREVPPEIIWPGGFVPAATVRIAVGDLALVTGAKGNRMLYGRDQWTSSTSLVEEEFPPRLAEGNPSWFGDSFARKGVPPWDSRAGLDLGEGFQLDFLFAWLMFKYERYRSLMTLNLEIDAPVSDIQERHFVKATGTGYFFDITAGYEGFSAGIALARRNAFLKAIPALLNSAYESLDRTLKPIPLTGRIDDWYFDSGELRVLLGTGFQAQIRPGVQYEVLGSGDTILEVIQSSSTGSVAKMVRGHVQEMRVGQIVRQVEGGLVKAKSIKITGGISSTESIEVPARSISQPPLNEAILPKTSRFQAFLRSLLEAVFLPYRIWRYSQYDQPFRGPYRQIQPDEVVVAVLDSGIDYNHPWIQNQIWVNPNPAEDAWGQRDSAGWDFISGDPRPYDDGYHGTAVASAVLGIAPRARLMPVKIFNPWGITRSDAVYSAFVYAVDRGARIVLCAWGTRKNSAALRRGVEYATRRGVVVVAAAGDGEEYPASLSEENDRVISVPATLPANSVWVAYPRKQRIRSGGSAIAAARVAGELALGWDSRSIESE